MQGVQASDVLLPMCLKVFTEVKKRTLQQTLAVQIERDKQAADAAVAVMKWVYQLELGM